MNQCPECEKPKYVKCCHNCKKDAGKCEVYHACGDDCPEWEEMTKTNADRIRAMSDEELARLFVKAPLCRASETKVDCRQTKSCLQCLTEWLKQPADMRGEEDGNQ